MRKSELLTFNSILCTRQTETANYSGKIKFNNTVMKWNVLHRGKSKNTYFLYSCNHIIKNDETRPQYTVVGTIGSFWGSTDWVLNT